MKISIERLRRFCEDADDSHAALMAASQRQREARARVETSERNVDIHQANAFSDKKARARVKADLATDKDAYAAALAAYERAAEVHNRTRRLAYAGQQLAERLGVIPDDLRPI